MVLKRKFHGKWAMADAAVTAGALGYRAARGAYKQYSKRRKTNPKARYRKAFSRTKTNQKRRRKTRNGTATVIRQSPGKTSFSNTVIKYKPMGITKLYTRLSNNIAYHYVSGGTLSTTPAQGLNRQNVFDVSSLYSAVDISTIVKAYFDNLLAGDPYKDYWDAPLGRTSLKMFFKNCTQEFEFLNQSEAPCTMTFYTFMQKNSTNQNDSPRTAWVTAISQTGGAIVGGPVTIATPGLVPNSYKQFNIQFKTLNKTVIELQPGIPHIHKVHFSPQRIIDYLYAHNMTSIRGISLYNMVVTQGSPVDTLQGLNFAGGGGGPGVNLITYSPTKIIYTLKNSYNWTLLNALPANNYYNNSLSNISVPAAPPLTAGLWQQNAVSGSGPTDMLDMALIG